MDTVSPQTLLARLNWRYATKKFDPTRKIPADVWSALESAIVATPSSFGMQPWQFIVVTDPATKTALQAAAWNQPQVGQCSHYLVFARRRAVDPTDTERLMARTSQVRGAPREALAGYAGMINSYLSKPASEFDTGVWAAKQLYIALGFFLESAAMLGIDACPMEGISGADFDRILKLDGTPYTTVVTAAAGYRAADDADAAKPKVRFPAAEVIRHV